MVDQVARVFGDAAAYVPSRDDGQPRRRCRWSEKHTDRRLGQPMHMRARAEKSFKGSTLEPSAADPDLPMFDKLAHCQAEIVHIGFHPDRVWRREMAAGHAEPVGKQSDEGGITEIEMAAETCDDDRYAGGDCFGGRQVQSLSPCRQDERVRLRVERD